MSHPRSLLSRGGIRAPARSVYYLWWDHRWNEEPWSLEFHALDFASELARRGFAHQTSSATILRGFASRHNVRTT
jgi:hypothetical protein